MWKDKSDRAGVKSLRCTYEIKGLNLDRFINVIKNHKIPLYDIKKYGNKRLIVSVKFSTSEKFFAIAKKMCYNIKKVGEKGTLYPLLSLYRKVGLVVGAIMVFLSAYFADGLIFSFAFSGSGSVYKREVQEFLTQKNIKQFSRFQDIDLGVLEDEILAVNPHLSFVSCKKQGSVLRLELYSSNETVNKLNGNAQNLISNESGVVESIKVYRGTPLVKVGDVVEENQVLVDGVMQVKDQIVQTNVLAVVSVICQKTFLYQSQFDGEQEKAVIFAEQRYADLSVIDSVVEVESVGDQYLYTVTLKYRKILSVG